MLGGYLYSNKFTFSYVVLRNIYGTENYPVIKIAIEFHRAKKKG